MTLPTWPINTRETKEQIIGMIGRNIEFFYVYSSYECPTCALDPITNTSVDSFCPTCSGEYWIDVFSGVTMSAHVTWKFDYYTDNVPGGNYLIGDARVKVMHTPERETIVKASKRVVVDGKTMNIEKTTLLGAPVDRIVVDLKELEE